MPLVIDATVGGPNANSYETLVEAQAYFDSRLPLAGWDNADSQNVLLTMACRVMEGWSSALKQLVTPDGGVPAYYIVSRQWTGLPASPTQRLSWPRTGMFDANGNPIPANVIPSDLKDAQSEFAGQLGNADRTLDLDQIVQGIASLKAGSVALTFKKQFQPQVIPDAVLNLLVPGWLTDELYIPAQVAIFDIISTDVHQ
jgi:hypothetical protein